MSETKRPKLFTKANAFKVLIFYLTFHIFFYLLSLLFNATFMQLFSLKDMGSSDFTFNDLYYRIADSENFEKRTHFRNKKSVVLINTGSLRRENFRAELASLLLRLEDYKPAVAAIDHEFSNDTSIAGTADLIEAAGYLGNMIIWGHDNRSQNVLHLGEKGAVGIPMQVSIRYYSCSDSSLGFKAALRISDKVQPLPNKQDSFPLHYCSYERGISDWQDDMNRLYDINFKAVEASTFFASDSISNDKLKQLIKGKVLILGHLGSGGIYNEFDIEDKFRVPVDPFDMSSRERIMPGPVIHANAIENFLHPEFMFYEIKGFQLIFWQQAAYILFLVFILFVSIDSNIKRIILGLVSIASLFLVLQLMLWGVYISMGSMLLQLLVIEEITEMFEPYYKKLENYFKKENHESN